MSETSGPFPFIGVSRTSTEQRFYFSIHACAACGTAEFEKPQYSGGIITDGGRQYSGEFYVLACSACGQIRRYLFEEDRAADQRFTAFCDAAYRAEGFFGWLDSKATPSPRLIRLTRQLGHPDDPSQIISPAEFAAEHARVAAGIPPQAEWAGLDYVTFSKIPGGLMRALSCLVELAKFAPAGADEVDVATTASDEARQLRAEHAEWFRRDWIDARIAEIGILHDACYPEWERRAALPASDPASSLHPRPDERPILPPLSPASLRMHEHWLDDKPGQRLSAKGVDATAAKLATRNLSAAIFEDVVLDHADLSFARLHGASLTRVRAHEANISNAMVAGVTLVDCDFERVSLALTKLGDSTITGCKFVRADLQRSTWYRAKVRQCSFADASLADPGLDKAEFTDCDFRGATFASTRGVLGTASDAVFLRCDLRDTDWTGLGLFRTRFIDCKLAGSRGLPKLEETVIERADLSPAGDGSSLGGLREVAALWGIDLDAPPPPPAPARPVTHVSQHFELRHDEGDVLLDEARRLGYHPAHELVRRGVELWLVVDVLVPVESASHLTDTVAAFRASQAARARPAPPVPEPPPEPPPVAAPERALAIIDASLDSGASFEDTVAALIATGITRDQALEAMIDPESLRAPRPR